MDAAAKTVESLSQHILPEKPHHLSFHSHWRYRPRPEEATPNSSSGTRFEEWHNTRLQYMTLVSQADRGTVLTRPYYDMREEPPKPVPREVSALAKSGSEKKKKLSLSDYKNKKTGAPPSASPPEPVVARHKEGDRSVVRLAAPAANAAAAPKPTNLDAKPTPDSLKPVIEFRKPDITRPSEPQPPSLDTKPRPPREVTGIDMRLPPKPPSLPPKPPSPSAAKKRLADTEDEARPQKRPRPDDRRPIDRPPPHRDDISRQKDRPLQNAREASSHRDDRPSSSSSLPNGRTILKGALSSGRHSSPGARPRGDSVNGVRPPLGGSNRSTPTKPDASKSSVPPLLSPLHLSFDDHDRLLGTADEDSNTKRDRRKRDDWGDTASTVKATTKRMDSSAGRRNKNPTVIPPLLSPTLPPVVEAELRKREKSTPESADDRPLKDGKSAPGTKKKPATGADDDDETHNRLGHRRRLIVVLSIPKTLRQSFRRMFPPPVGRKDAAQAHEREREKERHRARSDEASQPAPARKRPISAADMPADSLASKRPRTSDVARIAATPSTPSNKKSTAMSRVSSSNSMAQTPGDLVSATPMAVPPIDRRPNGQDVPSRRQEPSDAFLEMSDRLQAKGKTLKHGADLLRSLRSPSAKNKNKPSESKVKLGYALGIESIIAFIMAFQAHNVGRGMMNKRADPQHWDSMWPLINFTRKEMAGDETNNFRPLKAMLLLLQAVCLEEVTKTFAHIDPSSLTASQTLEFIVKTQRRRAEVWPMMREAYASIGSSSMRIDFVPWYNIDDITDSALRILRRWCSDERVDWTPEPMLRECWPIAPAKPGHT